jgi:hypothetical protein
VRPRPSESQSSSESRIPRQNVDENALAVPVDAPGAEHALLGAGRPDREVDRIEEERDELDLGQVTLAEGAVALTELLAEARGGRRAHLAEAGLDAERLDVAHRQPPDEGADDQRLERLGLEQALRLAREQLRGERLGGLAQLRDLDLELALAGAQLARPVAVALAGQRVDAALVALAAEEGVELVFDGALDDQLGAEAGELAQRAFGVGGRQALGEQGVDLILDVGRRRYGASHGVGLPSWSS